MRMRLMYWKDIQWNLLSGRKLAGLTATNASSGGISNWDRHKSKRLWNAFWWLQTSNALVNWSLGIFDLQQRTLRSRGSNWRKQWSRPLPRKFLYHYDTRSFLDNSIWSGNGSCNDQVCPNVCGSAIINVVERVVGFCLWSRNILPSAKPFQRSGPA